MQPTYHRLAVKNHFEGHGTHQITFTDWGPSDAQQAVVCVHGLTRNARDFDALAQSLSAQGRRVLCLNMAGRGDSEWLVNPMDYSYPSYMADCLAVLDNFHLRKVDWVGTSMGGILGMMIASAQPDRIRRLVLNDVGTTLKADALIRIYAYVAAMPRAFSDRAEAELYLQKIYAPFGIVATQHWDAFVQHSLQDYGETVRLACDPLILEPMRLLTEDFTKIQDINLGSLWESIDHPTLILRGAQSDVLDVETVSAMRASNPHAVSVTIEGVGHAPSLMPLEQTSLVTEWLCRHPLAALGLA